MSQVPQGEDWWQASDDLWYPPPNPMHSDPSGGYAPPPEEYQPAHGPGPAGDGASTRTALVAVVGLLVVGAMTIVAMFVLSGDDGGSNDDEVGLEPINGERGGEGDTETDESGNTETTPPPNESDVPPSTEPPSTAPPSPPSGGGTAVVDASALRWDGGCVWAGHEDTRPYYSAPPTTQGESCNNAVGFVPNGDTVTLVCTASGGRDIGDDQGNRSATWYQISYGGATGYMSSLYFTDWANPPSVPAC